MQDAAASGVQMVLMFTDVVDSVALKRELGDQAYLNLFKQHRGIVEAAVASCDGEVVEFTGDGFLIRFRVPGDAVRAALMVQVGMAAHAWGERVLRIRSGIHAGTAVEVEGVPGRRNVSGLAVDMAARVMGLSEPGQVLLTRAAFDDARQYVREHPGVGAAPRSPEPQEQSEGGGAPPPPSIQWMAHGPYLFKGSDDALEVFEVGTAGLAPLRAPRDSEKAKRAVTPGEESMYDWRPAVGLDLPRRANWVLERKLGEGGFGEVWLARHRKTGDRRVFKFCFDADRLRSFRRELTLFRLLREALGDRKDIARIFDVSLEAPPYFLESEYAPGGDLYEWSAARGGIGTLSLEQRLDMLRRIAEAVAAAHSVGVLHKDLKPSNVLMDVSEDGSPRPKLADFGIGILADRSRLDGAGFTVAGFTGAATLTQNDSSRTGTRLYSPPESLTNVRTTDGEAAKPAPFTAKGDVYALGVMLYQFVIGDLDRPLAIGWERNVEAALSGRSDPATTGRDGDAATTGRDGDPATTGRDGDPATTGRDGDAATTGRDGDAATTGRDGDPATTGRDADANSARHSRAATAMREGAHPPLDAHLLTVISRDIADMVEGDPERRLASAAEVARRLATVNERRGQLERDEIAAQAAEEANRRAAIAEQRRRKTRAVALVSVGVLVLLMVVGAIAFMNVMAARDEAVASEQRARIARDQAEDLRAKEASARNAAIAEALRAQREEQKRVELEELRSFRLPDWFANKSDEVAGRFYGYGMARGVLSRRDLSRSSNEAGLAARRDLLASLGVRIQSSVEEYSRDANFDGAGSTPLAQIESAVRCGAPYVGVVGWRECRSEQIGHWYFCRGYIDADGSFETFAALYRALVELNAQDLPEVYMREKSIEGDANTDREPNVSAPTADPKPPDWSLEEPIEESTLVYSGSATMFGAMTPDQCRQQAYFSVARQMGGLFRSAVSGTTEARAVNPASSGEARKIVGKESVRASVDGFLFGLVVDKERFDESTATYHIRCKLRSFEGFFKGRLPPESLPASADPFVPFIEGEGLDSRASTLLTFVQATGSRFIEARAVMDYLVASSRSFTATAEERQTREKLKEEFSRLRQAFFEKLDEKLRESEESDREASGAGKKD